MIRIRIIQHCTRGAVRPQSGCVENFFFILSCTGHRSQVFEMLPAFSFISRACAFRAGDDASIFSSGPIGSPSGGKKWALTQWAGFSDILWRILSLAKKTLNGHRTGFEPQCKSPFGKWVKAPGTRRSRLSLNDDHSLCPTLRTVGGVVEPYQR